MRVIGGCARGRRLKTRKGMETRPTADRVKESLFNILSPYLLQCRFLDVFAGNGGIGIEALSRGAAACVFVEKNCQCVKIIKENLAITGFSGKSLVITREARPALVELAQREERFDIIFLDPPYHSNELGPVIQLIGELGLLQQGGFAVVEHHRQDTAWRNKFLTVVREKAYGDTALSFLAPSGGDGSPLSEKNGGE